MWVFSVIVKTGCETDGSFYITSQDGVLDAWDILYQQKAPLLSIKVCDDAVNCIKVHDQGCLMAVGCNNGNTSLLELSDSLSVSNKWVKATVLLPTTYTSTIYPHLFEWKE